MPSSTPISVTRYRPAILIIAGTAAAYLTYLLYSSSQTPPSNGLHRSNAVRRPNARQRRRASQTARVIALLDGDTPLALGDLSVNDVQISLDQAYHSPNELRHTLHQSQPDATAHDVAAIMEVVYDTYLDRLLALFSTTRPLSSAEVEAVVAWVGDRVPDSSAVPRAVERHALMLPSRENPAADGSDSAAPTELSWRSDEDTEDDGVDPDAQTLQRTLYHIAEDRARQEGVVHRGITCNGCDEKPIRGTRWHCANCADFDLCSNCEATYSHIKTHIFYKIRVPAPYLSIARQEPLYPGKPHMMSPAINSALKRRLLAETKMETEEIEALWDQFTCLAGTEWLADSSNVGWALDRRAFNHAFIPRYNGFVTAPNLIYDRIFAYYDTDNNGLIGIEEWIKGLDGMHTSDGHVKSRIVFDGYDVDGDGYVSRKDILRVFRAFYAIEKEATRNFVSEITEDLSVRNALDTIRSSQPLGSAFPPHNLSMRNAADNRLRMKQQIGVDNTRPIVHDEIPDLADREEMLRATDFRNVGSAGLPQSAQGHAVTDRWARRQFYVDEEEGLNRPDGVEDDVGHGGDERSENGDQIHDPELTTEQTSNRPRWSRSSSRVRFQDDVDVETRSNASTSSRPFGERWGGYEIPEPEKDLGKEVLYQITQQGFNELLNPLFEDLETNAMDAYATRNERRRCDTSIEQVKQCFKTQARAHNRATCKIGIFRYSKCVVDMFCKVVNDGLTYSRFSDDFSYDHFGGLFKNVDGTKLTHEEAKTRLLGILTAVERSFISTIDIPEEWAIDDMSLWNAWLCSNQVYREVVDAALSCASRVGWISESVSRQPSAECSVSTSTLPIYRDPTMPQFRPNSLADINIVASSTDQSSEESDGSETTDESSVSEDYASVYHRYQEGEDQLASVPKGPFFAFSIPEIEGTGSTKQETTEDTESASAPTITSPASNVLVLRDEPPATADSRSPASSPSDERESDAPVPNWRKYTNNPVMHLLYINFDNEIPKLQSAPRPVVHSTNPYQIETNQQRPLIRHVCELAMKPKSDSHNIMLARLEAVQQEINERKGSGLINFEEFDRYMQEGKLKFLESWMEWVSI
jgi:Ca2+-binding EF-hand superfamily protein